jgi:hypothetical protein
VKKKKRAPRTVCSVFAPFADENSLLRLAFAPAQFCTLLFALQLLHSTTFLPF